MATSETPRTLRAASVLLAVVVPAAAMSIGALLPLPLVIVTLAATAASILVWVNPPRLSSRAGRAVIACSILLLGFTILQAIPLPHSLVAAVASTNADVWARALAPFRDAGPAVHALSVAPAATHVEILRGVLYASVFLASLGIASEGRGRRQLEIVIVASGCLLALVTLGHAAVHTDRVFGIYKPHDVQGFVIGRLGPLLNPNHLAAYVNIAACVAAGIALEERRLVARSVAGAAMLLLAGTSVWAGSRGGTGSLVFGGVVLVAFSVLRRRTWKRLRSGGMEAIVLFVALGAAGVLLGLGLSDVALGDLTQRDVSKLEIIRQAFRIVPLTPVFGTGRGAFETMYPVVREGPAYSTFLRAENIVAQWTVEWGVPVSVAAFFLLLLALRPRPLFKAHEPAFGAWTGLAVAVLHELVDFHLEVPAVGILAATCLGIVAASNASVLRRRSETSIRLTPRRYAFAIVPIALVAACVVIWEKEHSLAEDRDAIAALALDMTTPEETFRTELRAAMLRYPAEPFFPLAAAVHYQGTKRESVVPWVGRALERYPRFGRAHLVLARSLATSGRRAQARLEYRLAYEYDVHLRGSVVREAPSLVDDEFSALDLVPEGPEGIVMLDALADRIAERLPSTAFRVDEHLAQRDASAERLLRRQILATMSDLKHQHPWCSDREVCAAPAFAVADALIRRVPEQCEPYVLRAQLQIAVGRADAGLDELARSIERTSQPATCLRELVGLALMLGDKRRTDAAFESATRFSCGSREECVNLYAWAANIEEGRGNVLRSISFHKRAADLSPEDDAHLLKVAELAERAGLAGEALETDRKLLQRHPGDADLAKRESDLRGRVLKRVPGTTP